MNELNGSCTVDSVQLRGVSGMRVDAVAGPVGPPYPRISQRACATSRRVHIHLVRAEPTDIRVVRDGARTIRTFDESLDGFASAAGNCERGQAATLIAPAFADSIVIGVMNIGTVPTPSISSVGPYDSTAKTDGQT